ncbi:hypothetical protein GJ496_003982 [Pomphorhynchus laevis]|nr:hypothetical protein GJ496_003982 [Pomphorhynchus laevis]
MDDISQTNTCNDDYTATITQQSANANSKFSASDSNDSPSKSSRWEINESDTSNLDQLDSLNNLTTKNKKKALKQTDDGIDERFISSDNDQKRVKLADLEERKNHVHRKALGFIVGQTETDWKRMSDLYNPGGPKIIKMNIWVSSNDLNSLYIYLSPSIPNENENFSAAQFKINLVTCQQQCNFEVQKPQLDNTYDGRIFILAKLSEQPNTNFTDLIYNSFESASYYKLCSKIEIVLANDKKTLNSIVLLLTNNEQSQDCSKIINITVKNTPIDLPIDTRSYFEILNESTNKKKTEKTTNTQFLSKYWFYILFALVVVSVIRSSLDQLQENA